MQPLDSTARPRGRLVDVKESSRQGIIVATGSLFKIAYQILRGTDCRRYITVWGWLPEHSAIRDQNERALAVLY